MKINYTLWMLALSLFLVTPAWAQGTLFVEGSNVGIGVAVPGDALHIARPSGDAIVRVTTDGAASNGEQAGFRFVTDAGANRWDARIGGVGNLIYNYNSGPVESTYHTNGNLSILGTLNQGSSRAVKHDVDPVDGRSVLQKVMSLPVSTWRYDASPDVLHMGPMAEDLSAAFGLGSGPSVISAIDADGIALAAIQGLKAEKDTELEALREENARLRAELEEIKELVESLAPQN